MNKFKVGDRVKIKRAPYTGIIKEIIKENDIKVYEELGITPRKYTVELNGVEEFYNYTDYDLELIKEDKIEELKTTVLEYKYTLPNMQNDFNREIEKTHNKINEIIREVNKLKQQEEHNIKCEITE